MRDMNFSIAVSPEGAVTRTGSLATAHINTLRQARIDIKRQGVAVLDAAANRKLALNEQKQVDAIQREIEAVDQAIILAERERDLEISEGSTDRARASVIEPARGRRFAQMFPHVPLTYGDFASTEE